jgi:spore maturation protein CgeB
LPRSIRFHTPGAYGVPGVWGREYDITLSTSKMGLNLNRQEIHDWYSSARMAQIAGNGLLVFTHTKGGFGRLMPKESLVYFSDARELSDLVVEFHNDNEMRKSWAANSYAFFHEQMNNTLFAQYIVEQSLGLPFSHPYVWHLDD